MWSYQVIPLWARVNVEAMAMKGYFAFPKALALQEPEQQIVYPGHLLVGSNLSTEMQLVYSTAPTQKALNISNLFSLTYKDISNF